MPFRPEEPGPAYNTMLEGVGIARQAVRQGWDQLKDIRTATEDIYQTGKAHTLGIKWNMAFRFKIQDNRNCL